MAKHIGGLLTIWLGFGLWSRLGGLGPNFSVVKKGVYKIFLLHFPLFLAGDPLDLWTLGFSYQAYLVIRPYAGF